MKPALLLAAMAALTACAQLGSGGDGAASRGAPQIEVIAQDPTSPGLQLTVIDRRTRGELQLIGVNGDVQTWGTQNAVAVSLRRGVLISSSGLGHDLAGADPQPTLAALGGRSAGAYRRTLRYLTGEDHVRVLTADCAMAFVGVANGLRHFKESCAAADQSFTNQFWLDQTGQPRRTLQWVSPEVGYVETERLRL